MKCALHYILLAYWVVLLIRVLSSWLPRPPTSGPGRAFLTLIYDLTDPVLRPFRNLIPPMRMGAMADDFLDEVTEELALLLDEVRQLRERAGMPPLPSAGGGDATVALKTADDIVRQAREEAAEILRKARTEAAPSGAGAGPALNPFLS